jgi:DNA (cytosine-5)-methyltransferase 1
VTAYYNEVDPGAAAWLRELIRCGHIAPGDVDTRSIEDVSPADLMGYDQCHFFAGIGVWSYALRCAGIPDDFKVWTGSCPCQPFSTAGKGTGFADERHLWPAFHWLISQCGPERVLGEQVAGKDGFAWFDLVSTDMEALGYACGAVSFPAAGIGAPHIRERLYWMADAMRGGQPRSRVMGRPGNPTQKADWEIHRVVNAGGGGGVADTDGGDASEWQKQCLGEQRREPEDGNSCMGAHPQRSATDLGCEYSGPTNGIWRDADWLYCRDGKWRPVEPGTFPLAHGPAASVGRLRGYGNAIVAPQAQAFIEVCFGGVTP